MSRVTCNRDYVNFSYACREPATSGSSQIRAFDRDCLIAVMLCSLNKSPHTEETNLEP